jgi:hypothetical protein
MSTIPGSCRSGQVACVMGLTYLRLSLSHSHTQSSGMSLPLCPRGTHTGARGNRGQEEGGREREGEKEREKLRHDREPGRHCRRLCCKYGPIQAWEPLLHCCLHNSLPEALGMQPTIATTPSLTSSHDVPGTFGQSSFTTWAEERRAGPN